MKPLYLDLNLGLGDALICNGMVRYFAASGRLIIVPAWEHNLPTVRHMFSDLDNVSVVTADGDKPGPHPAFEILSVGINRSGFGQVEPWDKQFYVFADLDIDVKWDLFHVPRSDSERPSYGPIVLMHEDVQRGFEIDIQRCTFSETPTYMDFHPAAPLLTDWRNVIEFAREIHVIDSAPMHLCELMPTRGKLFYHKYARAQGNRNHRDATFRKEWTVYE